MTTLNLTHNPAITTRYIGDNIELYLRGVLYTRSSDIKIIKSLITRLCLRLHISKL